MRCTTNALIAEGDLGVMIIVGQVSSQEEANEISFIAKIFIVGQQFRSLSGRNRDT
jgi:hypothetical protein